MGNKSEDKSWKLQEKVSKELKCLFVRNSILASLALEDPWLLGLTSWKREWRNDMKKAIGEGSSYLSGPPKIDRNDMKVE